MIGSAVFAMLAAGRGEVEDLYMWAGQRVNLCQTGQSVRGYAKAVDLSLVNDGAVFL